MSLPDELVALVETRAAVERRNVSNMIAVLLEMGLTHDQNGAVMVNGPALPAGGKEFRGTDPKVKK